MSSRRLPRSPRNSASPELVERLERSRERVRQRRVLARQREQTIAAAVRRYLQAWQAITACEAARDREVADLRDRISAVQDRATEEITRLHADQAATAALIRDQGQSDDDVADLLEISAKQARQLISTARAHASDPQPSRASSQEVPRARRQAPPGSGSREFPTPGADFGAGPVDRGSSD
ncbi:MULTISPECIES: hypothetical protein [Nocardia]|uniref:hypothetical protein n=1 Tax=Nocardia TaxID=1817 RepID=UPI000D69B89F|nr:MULTISPECIES: hypothetical protein [Nocardia]